MSQIRATIEYDFRIKQGVAVLNEIMLIKVSATENNNKFYHLRLDDNGTTVHKRWGRVGTDGQKQSSPGGQTLFDRIVREKSRHGYKQVDLVTSSGTKAVARAVGADKTRLAEIAKKSLASDSKSRRVTELVDRLVAVNRHEIIEASGGMIEINTDGVITTPLGLISLDSITAAEKILKSLANRRTPKESRVTMLESYLSFIPQKIPMRGWQDVFLASPESIAKQSEFLDQLKNSYTWAEAERKARAADPTNDAEVEEQYQNLFKYTIKEVRSASVLASIERYFESSKNRTHHASTAQMKLKRVYVLSDPAGAELYSGVLKEVGNEKRLWHGTRAFNVLSILRKGLFVPPTHGTSIVTTGRMFGDGVYFSDQSTKSLNYARGVAPGMNGRSTSRNETCFMLLADVAMGWEFQPNRRGLTRFDSVALNAAHHGSDDKGRKYNSISVKGGTCGVLNNEMIVWNTNQVNVRYLCEFGN